MDREYIFDKLSKLQDRFLGFFQHKKKVKALENYGESKDFPHRKYLTLVKTCLDDGFLDEQEVNFLDYILQKYELNYLDWFHRTKRLKEQMALATKQQKTKKFYEKKIEQNCFGFYHPGLMSQPSQPVFKSPRMHARS